MIVAISSLVLALLTVNLQTTIRRGHTSNGRPTSPHSFHSRYRSTMLELRYSELVIVQEEVQKIHTTMRSSGNRSCSVLSVGRNASSSVVSAGASDSRTSP